MLPLMSDLTGANAVGPNTSKKKTIVFIFHIHFSPYFKLNKSNKI